MQQDKITSCKSDNPFKIVSVDLFNILKDKLFFFSILSQPLYAIYCSGRGIELIP